MFVYKGFQIVDRDYDKVTNAILDAISRDCPFSQYLVQHEVLGGGRAWRIIGYEGRTISM